MDSLQLVTSYVILNIILFIIGLYVLIKGSDWFVSAASRIAKKHNISEIVIGLTIVSIGTSLPELATNIYASIVNQGSISLGNVVGSNIANICLVLALGGIITGGIKVSRSILRSDIVILVLTFIFLLFLTVFTDKFSFGALSGYLGRIDGVILLVIFSCYMLFVMKNSSSLKKKEKVDTINADSNYSEFKDYMLLIVGMIIIFIGAKLLVDNIVWCAVRFHVPKSVIAASVIAFGTSVPELAVTITGAVKGKNDLALGNVIGSCFFNITGVLGISVCIRPIIASSSMIYIMMPTMILASLLLLIFPGKQGFINRKKSVILLIIYAVFIAYSLKSMI